MSREKLSVKVWFFEANGEGERSARRVCWLSAGVILLLGMSLILLWAIVRAFGDEAVLGYLAGKLRWK